MSNQKPGYMFVRMVITFCQIVVSFVALRNKIIYNIRSCFWLFWENEYNKWPKNEIRKLSDITYLIITDSAIYVTGVNTLMYIFIFTTVGG